MVDFSLTEEQLAIQKVARDFAENEIKPVAAEIDQIQDPKESFPWDIYQQANELGFNKILIPEEYGGVGLTEIEACLIVEELAVADVGIAGSYFVQNGNIRIIQDSCSEEQKQHYFSACCSDPKDRYFIAIGYTEHGSTGDRSLRDRQVGKLGGMQTVEPEDFFTNKFIPPAEQNEMKTMARRDGAEWVINGMKRFITFGRQASLYLTMAKTDTNQADIAAISGFPVEAGSPGHSFGHVEDKMGHRLMENSEVIYDDVRVAESKRFDYMKTMYTRGNSMNTMCAASAVGIARRAFEEALAYSQVRYKGGQKIVFHQNVQRYLIDMATNIKTARLLCWQAAVANASATGHTILPEMAKVYCTEMAVDTVDKAMQVFGGYGYMHDFPMEKLWRDVRIMTIYDGANDFLRYVLMMPEIVREGSA